MTSCTRGKASPSRTTERRLFADSGGYCQNPGCLSPLFLDLEDTTIHIAEMAHIISAGNSGPRSDSSLTPEERGRYENLILLCPTCHTIIDKAEQQYPESIILEWKSKHREKISNAFGLKQFNSRSSVRKAIEPILRENKTIFEIYGPMTDERYNPESSMRSLWLRKIKSQIIPNNRKLLSLCDSNTQYLSDQEIGVLELFRQHVEDFEAKHLWASNVNGLQFPVDMNKLFL
ncbi:MAG: HNH endonuclease [Okeania sp. SIO3H1]|nr:HNH endonuclease [Okeania sp. SIO3H1]